MWHDAVPVASVGPAVQVSAGLLFRLNVSGWPAIGALVLPSLRTPDTVVVSE